MVRTVLVGAMLLVALALATPTAQAKGHGCHDLHGDSWDAKAISAYGTSCHGAFNVIRAGAGPIFCMGDTCDVGEYSCREKIISRFNGISRHYCHRSRGRYVFFTIVAP
jgi:hypothetical protein